jgi:hypothetical protein
LAFSYWIDNLGFVTERKLAAIFTKPSLGVSNWPVIYFINYTPTSSLAPFITAPSLLLLGQLGRDLEGLATVGGHVVRVVADHSTIVDLARDLAADTRRRRRRWHLDRHVIIGVVLIIVLVLVIKGGGGGGHNGRPAGAPVWA